MRRDLDSRPRFVEAIGIPRSARDFETLSYPSHNQHRRGDNALRGSEIAKQQMANLLI